MQPSIRVLNFKNTFKSINCVPINILDHKNMITNKISTNKLQIQYTDTDSE